METKTIAAHRLQSARRLFLQGISPREIAERLGITYRYVLRLLRKEGEDWAIPENVKQARLDAQAACVQLYYRLGFGAKRIAEKLGRSETWVRLQSKRKTAYQTTPVVEVELVKPVYSTEGKLIVEGQYLVFALSEREVFLKEKHGKKVFRAEVDNLFLKVKMPE